MPRTGARARCGNLSGAWLPAPGSTIAASLSLPTRASAVSLSGQLIEGSANELGRGVKVRPVGREETGTQLESIAGEPWQHMQVDVINFLPGRGAVSQEEVDALALHPRLAQRRCQVLRGREYRAAGWLGQVCQPRGVRARHDQ